MKRAISLFLALSMLCFATSAMADVTNSGVTGSRNNLSTMPTAANSNSMPCFRPGDTISFNVSGVTKDEELTVISYITGSASNLSDSTVQYINQYTLTGTTQAISYTIRDEASGIYAIKINDSVGSTVATFYYKVGRATAVLVQGQSSTVSAGTFGTPYRMVQMPDGTWSIGFIGKVTLDSTVVNLMEMGATPGFTVKNTSNSKTTKSYFGQTGNKAVIDLHGTKYEINGSRSFIYGLTVYNVPNGNQDNIQASVSLDN